MNATVKTRLHRLEKSAYLTRASITDQIVSMALQAIGDDDLAQVQRFATRGATFEDGTADEKAALERYQAEADAAAIVIQGQHRRKMVNSGSGARA